MLIRSLIVPVLCFASIAAVQAEEKNPAAAPTVDECSKELLLSYFPEPFVKETLKKNQIPEDKWSAIVKDLASNDKTVLPRVEGKADKMNPNPLKSPEYREQAITIFRETLLEIFTEVMNKNGITDKEQIQGMLDEIQHQKAKRFAKCMEKSRKEFEANTPKEESNAAPKANGSPQPH
ncbi:hypothetical protein [Estrella lausannensis]|uniref:Conserved putative secreted protein n=1 Tax=Estrella lausannensis TaxID=483423 RepID=A0A0H5DR25_9BACT|nr:hypothetical protein [Estrella lausannensis]CRX38074.1 Conserved putative secreted protein [Estrella lausannensis]